MRENQKVEGSDKKTLLVKGNSFILMLLITLVMCHSSNLQKSLKHVLIKIDFESIQNTVSKIMWLVVEVIAIFFLLSTLHFLNWEYKWYMNWMDCTALL